MIVLDDGSTDGTGDLVRATVADDPRFEVIDGGAEHPPEGWLGKPWACQRLAEAAAERPWPSDPAPDLLLFVDADVVLAPDAVRRIAGLMRDSGLDLASPYPRQIADHRRRTARPAAAAVVVDDDPAAGPGRGLPATLPDGRQRPGAGDHAGGLPSGPVATRPSATRSWRTSPWRVRSRPPAGGPTSPTAPTWPPAGCTPAARSSSTGTPSRSGRRSDPRWAPSGATGLLTFAYVLPPAAALLARSPGTRALGAAGYAAGVAGRVLVARRTGGRVADAWSHPLSILALDGLTGAVVVAPRARPARLEGPPAVHVSAGPSPARTSP